MLGNSSKQSVIMGAAFDIDSLNGPQRKLIREILIRAYPSRTDMKMLLSDEGFDELDNIVSQNNYRVQLFELILELQASGELGKFLRCAISNRPNNRLIQNLAPRISFIRATNSSDKIRGLERLVKNDGFRNLYDFTTQLHETAKKVCRISYKIENEKHFGTGFLFSKDIVITNFHVISPIINSSKITKILLEFDYFEENGVPSKADTRHISTKDNWLLAKSRNSKDEVNNPKTDELDFAILNLKEKPFDLSEVTSKQFFGAAKLSDILYVIHHPLGEPVKLSIGNMIQSPFEHRLRYDCDTLPGSSGGLVLNSELTPIAIHNSTDTGHKSTFNQGIPLNLVGEYLMGYDK